MIGSVLSGRYRLRSELGSGGMSTVYLADDATLDRPVAVKILHREMSDQPDQLERFGHEARAAAQLSHPNVVTVIDAGQDGGHPYIVFEYVEGETLKQRIKRLGRLDVIEAVAYTIEIARGIGVAHATRIVHRDVKPQNVLIDEEGRAKVTDFGIARSLDAEGLTAAGRVVGTTDYVSPEQATGREVDARSDIYSLGVVLYEMLTGEVPFKADNPVGVAMKHVNEGMPDVQGRRRGVSAALAAVVETCTAKNPDRRYPDTIAMLEDLEQALEVEVVRAGGVSGEATTVLESVPSPRRRLLRARGASRVGVAAVMIAAGAALTLAALTGGGVGPSAPAGTDRLELGGAEVFDPPPGDLAEHSDQVGFAIDGNPTGTVWTTETYQVQDLGKPGVGLILDAGRPATARSIEILSTRGGWDLEIRGSSSDAVPATLSDFTLLAPARTAGTDERISLDTAEGTFRYYLVWITRLAPVGEGSGRYRVEISDARLFG
jgi:eukaryotic-like serine/threonine-protein kinase